MKTLFLLTLSTVLTLSLSARENPFAETNAYEEEKARIIEKSEQTEEDVLNAQYIKEMQEKMNNMTSVEKKAEANKMKVKEAVNKINPVIKAKPTIKPKEKTYTKNEVKKLIKKAEKKNEAKTKAIVKKEIERIKADKPKQIVYVKPRTDIIEDDVTKEVQLLPFVKISYNNSKLTIHTDAKVSKKFSLDKEDKLIIDYKGIKNFYTKRENLVSNSFEKVAVGNHKKDRLYRVVVKLKDAPKNYKVEYKNNLISITKSNEM